MTRKLTNLHPILNPDAGCHHRPVGEHEVEQARREGCRIHHEYVEERQSTLVVDDDDNTILDENGDYIYEDEYVVIRDVWYAATPEWVADYHTAGGTWGYND